MNNAYTNATDIALQQEMVTHVYDCAKVSYNDNVIMAMSTNTGLKRIREIVVL